MSSVSFHPLRVRAVAPDTAEAVIVSFDVPEALRGQYAFTQGQYLTLRAIVNGQDLRRSYSVCSGVDDGELRVGVRKVQGGVFSTWINSELRPGDIVQVMVPQGRFFVPIQADSTRRYLGLAGGSGITPILSIIKTVLAREPRSRFTLLYGNRSLRSTMFKEELEDLKNRHLSRLVLHHVFSEEQTDASINSGVLNREKVAEFLRSLVPACALDEIFICGPHQMNDEAQAALLEAGVDTRRIHIERFGIAPGVAGSTAPTVAGAEPNAGAARQLEPAGTPRAARITIVRDGLRREIAWLGADSSILDCATEAGLDLPFSCTSGVCGTCRAKLLEGRVQMERNFALDESDVAAGFVLCCQARALTERVVLSFDAR